MDANISFGGGKGGVELQLGEKAAKPMTTVQVRVAHL